MNYEDKLVEFIDGELPEDDERELFSAISSDDSLRAHYKSLLSMSNAIKSGAPFYKPASDLKASVYNDLNISITTKHIPAFAKIFQNSKWNLLSGGIGALLTTTFFMVSTNFLSNDINYKNQHKMNVPSIYQIEAQPKIVKYGSPISANRYKKIKQDNIPFKVQSDLVQINEENNMNLIALSEPLPLINKNFSTEYNTNSKNFSDIAFNEFYLHENILNVSLEAKWNLNWNLPKETIQPAKLNEFNNLGFDVFFNVIESFDLGISIRQETFFVRYNEILNNDIKYNIEQNPNLTSYGISFRQKFLPDNNFQPLAQFNLSVNNFGIILRPSAGILYKINESFSLVQNIEYSNMLFTHKSKWFNASKIGLNFGINYKL